MAKLTSLLLFCLLIGSVSAWERPAGNRLPNTFSGIHIFADYPFNGSIDTSMAHFFATHCDLLFEEHDTADLRKLWTYNPDFIHLMYRNSIGATKLWAPLPNDSAIYCKDYTNNTFRFWPGGCPTYGCETMNIGNYPDPEWDFGNTHPSTVYRDYWNRTQDSLSKAFHCNGFFVDNVTAPYGGTFPDPWFEDQWAVAMRAFLDTAKARNPDIILVPNVTMFNSIFMYHTVKYANYEAALTEGVFEPSNSSGMWRGQASRILEHDRLGKGFLILRSGQNDSVRMRLFHLVSYLVSKGSMTYLNMPVNYDVWWYPEWNTQIGYPTDNRHLTCAFDPSKNIDTLVNVYRGGGATGETGWFFRKYSNALVVVNPMNTQSYTVNLADMDGSRTYLQAIYPEPDRVYPKPAPFMVTPRGQPRLQTITYAPAAASFTLEPLHGYIFVADTNYKNPDTTFEVTGIDGASIRVGSTRLSLSAFPSPFNSQVTLRVEGAVTTLKAYDIAGRCVADLTHAVRNSSAVWNARNLAAGVYILKAVAGKQLVQKKVFLIR